MAKGCRTRNTPKDIEIRLRHEANFGCALCGCPIIENAHIIPYRVTHDFKFEDMVSLCPTCHHKADAGHFPDFVLYEAKKNPYNANTVHDSFMVTGGDLIVNLGKSRAINTPRVLVVKDFDIITIQRKSGMYLSLDVNFFDRFGRFVGIIADNKWTVDMTHFWDLEYKPQHLKIKNGSGNIEFEAKIHNGEVFIMGNMYYVGVPIIITSEMVTIGQNIRISGYTVINSPVGLDIW